MGGIMKNKAFIVFVFLLMLTGCITDEVVTTIFNPDGSSKRIVTFRTDKKDYKFKNLSIPVDSTWTITMKRDAADSLLYRVVAEKVFPDIRLVNDEYKDTPNSFSGVNRSASYEKKFMWFYTFFYYQETIYSLFNQYPMSEFLTKNEIGYLKARDEEKEKMFPGKDSLELKQFDQQVNEKVMKWSATCMFKEFYAGLRTIAQSHARADITPVKLSAERDSLLSFYILKFMDLDTAKRFSGTFENIFSITPDSLMAVYPQVFRKYTTLRDAFTNIIGRGYQNRVQLPGTVFDSNADITAGALLSWQIRPMRFIGEDFDMFAASKKVNTRAFFVAGIILFLALFIWFMPKKKV